MSIRMKITIITVVSMTAILLINIVYLLQSVNASISYWNEPLPAIIFMISIALMSMLIYLAVGIYTNRINQINFSLNRIQNNEVVLFKDVVIDETGSVMKQLEDVSKEIHYQEREYLRLVQTDSETDVPNRAYFFEHLEEIDTCDGALIISVELTDILRINAIKGVSYSEHILKNTAFRLNNHIGKKGFIGRLSTHHFAVYIPMETKISEQALLETALTIQERIATPHITEGKQTFIKHQFGIAYRQQEEKVPLTDLVYLSELAVMEKSNPIRPYIYMAHSELHTEQEEHDLMMDALRKSSNRKEFEVVYQPIVSMTTEDISLETLVRWTYKGRWISPTIFVPMIEEMGLIEELTSQVADKIMQDWLFWKGEFLSLTHISLNISPSMFKDGQPTSFLESLLKGMNTKDIQPHQICLEITENVLLNENTLKFIEECSSHGFLIALDDFGTGFSSLAYIANYDFHVLKIDRSFVKQLETNQKQREVAYAIVQLAKRLNIQVVAEGVETLEQLHILKQMGTDAIQGYYFSKPQFVRDWNPFQLNEKRRLLKV